MNIIGCLDTPTSGEYVLSGETVAGLDRNRLAEIRNQHIGFVFQNFNLLPYATALENVELPLLFGGVATARAQASGPRRCCAAWTSPTAWTTSPPEPSGGQMQRVAIARALVNQPGHRPRRRAHGQPRLRLGPGDRGPLPRAPRRRPDDRA